MTGRVVLLVDEGGSLLELACEALEQAGYEVRGAESVDAAAAGNADAPAVVVLDACLPTPGGLSSLIARLRRSLGAPILQVSGCGAVDAACRDNPVRADRFLVRPLHPAQLVAAVDQLCGEGAEPSAGFHGMYGSSHAMREVFRSIRQVAPTDSTVLITGETGTGKEMVARAIHEESTVAGGPFVPLDCGALPESLLESELFGHVKGAFTGAAGARRGLVESASGGTLFLDELCNMPPRLQMRLLRVLQEGCVRPVGSNRVVSVNVRIVAATNRELAEEVRRGRFREDLYYRLRVFTVELPPLRERFEDIDDITAAWLRKHSHGGGDSAAGVTPTALDVLRAYPWPGNVRELMCVLEGAAVRTEGGPIAVHHLPEDLLGKAIAAVEPDAPPSGDLAARTEKERIQFALREARGNRTRAADLLGISRTTLWRRLRTLDSEIAS